MLHSTGLRSRKSSTSSAQHHREALQLRTQADWAGREYIDLMSGSIKRIADFLNAFHLSCSSRLADLNSRYAKIHLPFFFMNEEYINWPPNTSENFSIVFHI